MLKTLNNFKNFIDNNLFKIFIETITSDIFFKHAFLIAHPIIGIYNDSIQEIVNKKNILYDLKCLQKELDFKSILMKKLNTEFNIIDGKILFDNAENNLKIIIIAIFISETMCKRTSTTEIHSILIYPYINLVLNAKLSMYYSMDDTDMSLLIINDKIEDQYSSENFFYYLKDDVRRCKKNRFIEIIIFCGNISGIGYTLFINYIKLLLDIIDKNKEDKVEYYLICVQPSITSHYLNLGFETISPDLLIDASDKFRGEKQNLIYKISSRIEEESKMIIVKPKSSCCTISG